MRLKRRQRKRKNQIVRMVSKMYFRLKNKMDVELLVNSMLTDPKYQLLKNRLYEISDILDFNYGEYRGETDMGGYILYFPDKASYKAMIPKLEEFYHIDKDCYEYEDTYSEPDNYAFCEDLYLLSSDDALVFVYPKEVLANV